MKYCDMCKTAQACHATGRCLVAPANELTEARRSATACSAVVHGKFLPDNPTQFDYLHAIRAVASRISNKQIFDLADAAMNLPNNTITDTENGVSQLAQERDAAIAELEAWRSEKGPEGWWVEHSDHMAQLEVWRDENAGLKDLLENTITERDRLKRNYDHERELHWQTLEKYRMHHEEAERLTEQQARYVAALLQIANTDYRGNRSHESQIVYKSLNPTTHAPQSQPASSPSSPPASSADA